MFALLEAVEAGVCCGSAGIYNLVATQRRPAEWGDQSRRPQAQHRRQLA